MGGQSPDYDAPRADVVDPAAEALDLLAEQGIAVPCDPDGIPVPPDWFRAYLDTTRVIPPVKTEGD